jgi:hypothetical protein
MEHYQFSDHANDANLLDENTNIIQSKRKENCSTNFI